MSHFKPNIQAFKAEADLSAKQYTFVKFGADEKSVLSCGAGERAIGILQNAPGLGEAAEVAIFGGGAYLKLGASVGLGQIVKSQADGEGEKASAAGDWCAAVAHQAGVAGDIVDVFVTPVVAAAAEA